MHLARLTLKNFRNHLDTSFDFGEGINVLLGDNGQGKTNVIEAISYLCLTKSFYAASDALVLHFGKEMFEVESDIVAENGHHRHVRVAYAAETNEKVFAVNKQRMEPFSSVIGTFPVVICSPEHTPITTGSPAERRKFVDLVISQSSAVYFHDLVEYRRVLRHRNTILANARWQTGDTDAMLAPWDEQLVSLGGAITWRRKQFVAEFQAFITSAYHHLVGPEEEPSIGYKPGTTIESCGSQKDVETLLRGELAERSAAERKLGISMVGPHRDEVPLTINGLDLRKFASQGQHKTFLVALKLGEFFYLKERCDETPIVLLDDVFSELDEHRSLKLLQYVEELNQTFVTSTTPHLFDHLVERPGKHRLFFISNGAVTETRTAAA
jgi:DNA replication and repair protein RecF